MFVELVKSVLAFLELSDRTSREASVGLYLRIYSELVVILVVKKDRETRIM